MYNMPIPKKVRRILAWEQNQAGVYIAEERALADSGQLHRVVTSRLFAVVRGSYGSDGLHHEQHGFVVSRNSFDELRQFPTLDEAKLYVESIYELEKT